MRTFLLSALAAAAALAGCASDTLGEDTVYRRLVDRFDSYDECIADGDFSACYQTLTLCADGRTRMNLDGQRQEGSYRLVDDMLALNELPSITFEFDLEKAASEQLPGRHPWERVEPLVVDCEP